MSQGEWDPVRRCVHCNVLLRNGLHEWKKEHKSFGGYHVCMTCHSKGLQPPKSWKATRDTRPSLTIREQLSELMGTEWWTVVALSRRLERDKSSVTYVLGKMFQDGAVEWRWSQSNARNNHKAKEWRLKDGS